MTQFMINLINVTFRFMMIWALLWLIAKGIKFLVKAFIPATRELIRDLRAWWRQEHPKAN